MIELRKAITDLTPAAEAWLLDRFGGVEQFLYGFSYHNHSHGLDVSTAAERIATELYEAGYVQLETVTLASYAGWRHDASQGEGHEARSAEIAANAMRARSLPEHSITTVTHMIAGTEVLRVDGFRIVQAANPDDLEQATLGDADLAVLGQRSGVYCALMLGIELQHRNGLIKLPSPGNGMLVEPHRDAMLKFLQFQIGLHGEHEFMLVAISRRLFPHQESNRDELERLLELYAADRISFSGMLVRAKQRAMS
jgi:hypothetical protein